MDQESDDKKRIYFLGNTGAPMNKSDTCGSDDDKLSDGRRANRNRQVSFVWNQGFHKFDNMKRRQSLMDPRELQRRREFTGKRFFGETQEYTEAKETKDTALKHRIIRRHSYDSIQSDQKQYVMNRASFATRFHDYPDDTSDGTSAVDSSSSSENSFNDAPKNVVYRVSFADPERVEAVQALLSKTKQSIIVHQRPPTFSKDDDPYHDKFAARVNSAVRIYHTTSSEEPIETKGKSTPSGACESSEVKVFIPGHEESSITVDEPKKQTQETVAEPKGLQVGKKEEPGPPQTQFLTTTPQGIQADRRCTTDEKTSIEIKIDSQSISPSEGQSGVDTSNRGSSLNLAPLCDLL